MFESPLDWCEACRQWVALDDAVADCARRHRCDAARCPLSARFTGVPEAAAGTREAERATGTPASAGKAGS